MGKLAEEVINTLGGEAVLVQYNVNLNLMKKWLGSYEEKTPEYDVMHAAMQAVEGGKITGSKIRDLALARAAFASLRLEGNSLLPLEKRFESMQEFLAQAMEKSQIESTRRLEGMSKLILSVNDKLGLPR